MTADVTYVVSEVRRDWTVRAAHRTVRCWRFPTLVDGYEFLVSDLIDRFGFTPMRAIGLAIELPCTVGACRFTIQRRSESARRRAWQRGRYW